MEVIVQALGPVLAAVHSHVVRLATDRGELSDIVTPEKIAQVCSDCALEHTSPWAHSLAKQ